MTAHSPYDAHPSIGGHTIAATLRPSAPIEASSPLAALNRAYQAWCASQPQLFMDFDGLGGQSGVREVDPKAHGAATLSASPVLVSGLSVEPVTAAHSPEVRGGLASRRAEPSCEPGTDGSSVAAPPSSAAVGRRASINTTGPGRMTSEVVRGRGQ